MFTWTKDELNDEQSDAIEAPGSIFLVACPGSGKTRALTYKIAYELSRLQSDRQFVVAITYTHRAADEIQERIEDLGVDTAQLWIGTIHAFCLEWIIRPYGIYEPKLAHGFRIIDHHERETLLDALCKPYTSPRITRYDCDYYFAADGYHLGCRDSSKRDHVHAIVREYLRTLLAQRLLDFELILYFAWRLISRRPVIADLLAKIVPLLLVDEYQDTKQIQYEILAAILKAGGGASRLFMVGDPNQAIYGSLGGYAIDVANLRAITGLAINERALSKNYRSSERIVAYYGHFNVHATAIEPAGDQRDYASLVSYDDAIAVDDLVDEVARLIRYNVETLGIAANEVCVLAPQWLHLATMTRRLAIRLPDYQFDGPGMAPFARDPENFWYKLARLALTEPSPGLFVRRLRWASEVLADLRDAGAALAAWTPRALLRECNAIRCPETDGLAYLGAFGAALFARLDIDLSRLPALQALQESFVASSRVRIANLEAEGLAGVGEVAFFKRVFQPRSGITVSTIHGVKGAEFDVVIAYALLEGMVPHFSDPGGDDSGRKLLYVIGSRARKNLHLFSEAGRKRGRFGAYGPTATLLACAFNYDIV